MRRLRAFFAILLLSGGIVVAIPSASSATTTVISGPNNVMTDATILAGDVLQFSPTVSTTLTVHGNLTVKGTLQMRPATAGVVHKLIFDDANENAEVGTPPGDPNVPYTQATSTDRGLWVLGGGVLDVAGTYREPWVHATTGLPVGTTSFVADHSVQGWGHGDLLEIAPMAQNDYAFEQAVVDSVSGTTVNLETPTTKGHGAVTLPGQAAATPEVLNLTRNAQIWGEPPNAKFPNSTTQNNNGHGRAHILINSSQTAVQTLNFALIRYMGPRQYISAITGSRYVIGRYAVHFHKSGEFNAGTNITGTVVRDSGSHAFVAHKSNGITFTKTIAYDDAETPYWWDVKANEEGFLNNDSTDRTTYSSTVAALIDTDPSAPSDRLAGYSASCGHANVLTNSVAIGIQQQGQSSGVLWPEGANACDNTWTVSSNVVHNNPAGGMFTWQNDTADPHNHTNTNVAYNNGSACLEQGAYRNAFQFAGFTCVGNGGSAGVISDSVGPLATDPASPQHFDDFTIRGQSLIPSALRINFHRSGSGKPTEMHRWNISGYTGKAVTVDELSQAGPSSGTYDFICWSLIDAGGGVHNLLSTDFNWIGVHPNSVYRIQRLNSGGTDTMTVVGGVPTWTHSATNIYPSC